MNSPDGAPPDYPWPAHLRDLEGRLASLDRVALANGLGPAITVLRGPLPGGREVVEAALSLCRTLYGNARSGEGVALGRAALDQSAVLGDAALERRSATACGLLLTDAGDIVGALDFHARALALATATGDAVELSRIWNNFGFTFGVAGSHTLAASCYQRAIAKVEAIAEPVFSRCSAYTNLANHLYQQNDVAEGLRCAMRAYRELTPAIEAQDPHAAILLHRNLVRLLIAAGRVPEAGTHVTAVTALADRTKSPRARIAAAIVRANYELATGQADIALTRLEDALTHAREAQAALRDTLASVVRAEESAGNVERALLRLQELSDLVYRSAIDRARAQVALAGLSGASLAGTDAMQEQARARLASHLGPPDCPEEWPALQRLAAAAALRLDDTGWHGIRVGALTKALALAIGWSPLAALELGLAAEVHDIGLTSVPEALFAKSGELSEQERALYDRHADAGAEILRDDRHPRLLLARDIARYHHARWDGRGHPAGVGGKSIPLPARLCAVADEYDSRVCGQRRAAPMTLDAALEAVRREAGGRLDPELALRFVDMVRDHASDHGIDPASTAGLEGFQEVVLLLQQDRGFL